jgi:hypothetical protein
MRSAYLWVLLLVCGVGCTKKNPAMSCPDGHCTDPSLPFCDVHGAIDGEPDTCIAVACTPAQFAACDGSNAIVCNSSGNDYETMPCASGCNPSSMACNECTPGDVMCGSNAVNKCDDSGHWMAIETCALSCVDAPMPHCAYLQPRYLANICDTPASASSLDVVNSGMFDSNTDANCNGGIVTQTGGPEICVVRYGTITIEANQTLTATPHSDIGMNRALAFVSDGPLTIAGLLDVSGKGSQCGPGGSTSFSGGAFMGTSGGGGAGFKTPGGPGATATTDGAAGNGGASTLDPALLDALIGGSYSYGGGGGAVTLVSCRDTVSVTDTGLIAAGGGGGGGGLNPGIGGAQGGGGGGTGGYIVLQGIGVSVAGALYANGGAGGGGADTTLNGGNPGQDARRSTTCAAGGAARSGSGPGGNGGCLNATPQGGFHATAANTAAGGGGGSTGFLQTYTPSGVTPNLAPFEVSPNLQPNATVPTR